MKLQAALILLNLGFIITDQLDSVALDSKDFQLDENFARIQQLQDRAKQWYKQQYGNLSFIHPGSSRVVNGVAVGAGEAPWQAQLNLVRGQGISFTCGGSLISSRTILSAGHCVNRMNTYRIRYGSNSRLSSPFPLADVESVKVHPAFNLATVTNDVALFILRSPIQPGANVRAIDLAQSTPQSGAGVTVFGFGLQNGRDRNSLATSLQKADMSIVSEQECRQFIARVGINKSPGHLCARAPNRGSCNGDSGGPLVIGGNGLQAGIVSFGIEGCPPGAIDVFTNVAHYYQWIRANMVGDNSGAQPPPANPPPGLPGPPPPPPPPVPHPSRAPPTCRWVCD